eukprot:3722153-Amphidinium_carterae.2
MQGARKHSESRVTFEAKTEGWAEAHLTDWRLEIEGFSTPRGSIRWEDEDYYVVLASHCQFQGIERGLDGPTIKAMRTLLGQKDMLPGPSSTRPVVAYG